MGRKQQPKDEGRKNHFFKEWIRDYYKGLLSLFVTFFIALILAWRFGYGFDPQGTLEYYLTHSIAIAKFPKITIGTCYPNEYGLDSHNTTMHFYPLTNNEKIHFHGGGKQARLYLGLQNDEQMLTLENMRLHIIFPPEAVMTDDNGTSLSDVRRVSPWLCLGTGNTSCYMNTGVLNPSDSVCLESMRVAFPKASVGQVVTIGYRVSSKDRRPAEGKFEVKIEE